MSQSTKTHLRGIRAVGPVMAQLLLIAALAFGAAARPVDRQEAVGRFWLRGFFAWVESAIDRGVEVLSKAGPIADPNG